MEHIIVKDWENDADVQLKEDFNLWIEASKAYYDVDAENLMDDIDFDELTFSLKDRLVDFHEQHKIITSSITKVVTNTQQTNFEHHELVSLAKIQWDPKLHYQNNNEILNFFDKNFDLLMGCWVGPKLDGHAIQVKIDIIKNSIIQITTRGGQDVTELLKNLPDIVALLDAGYPTINGELVLDKKIFAEKWSYDVLGEKDGYSNPRSAVGGVLKKKASDLRFVALTDGVSPVLHKKDSTKDIGFRVWHNVGKLTTEDTIGRKIMSFENFFHQFKAENYPFQIDGIVIGYKTETRIIKENYPMNLVSVKFPAPTARTKIIGMSWSQKKSGNLTPVYDVEPTLLDGVTVRNVNAYNYGKIKELQCGIGSIIEITKSNDIIPIVKKVITKSRDIKMPDVDYRVDGKHLIALDLEISEEYKFVLGLKLLNIEGIGETIAKQVGSLVNHDIVELFNQEHKPKIMQLMGAGKTFEKFCVIYQTKNIPLDLLIEMLQFNRCGRISSRKFAEILTGKKISTKSIDKQVMLNVCRGEGFQKIQSSQKRLKIFGINVIKPIEINDDTITFEMTGTPPGLTKKEFVEKMKLKFPNSAHTTLNKNTTYLITDSMTSSSSKMNKARKYNITISTYEEILNS